MKYYLDTINFSLFEYETFEEYETVTHFYNVGNFLTFNDSDNAYVTLTPQGDMCYVRNERVLCSFNLMDINDGFVMNLEGDCKAIYKLDNKYNLFRYLDYDILDNGVCYYGVSLLTSCLPTYNQDDVTNNLNIAICYDDGNITFQYEGNDYNTNKQTLTNYCRRLVPTNSLGTPNIFVINSLPIFGYTSLTNTNGEHAFTDVVINLPQFIQEVYPYATLDLCDDKLTFMVNEETDEVKYLNVGRVKEEDLYLKDAKAVYYHDGLPLFTYSNSKLVGVTKKLFNRVVFYNSSYTKYNTCDLLLDRDTLNFTVRNSYSYAEEGILYTGNLNNLIN